MRTASKIDQMGFSANQSSTYRYREFPVSGIFHFFCGIGTGIGKNWYRKKVSVPVLEKFGTGKKYRNRYRKNLVPEKSLGTGIGKIWYRKKYRYRYRKKFVTGTEFCRTNFGILKICNGYRYRLGTGTGNCSF